MGRNVSERSWRFDHGSLLADQLGGFRFMCDRSGNDMLGPCFDPMRHAPIGNTSWWLVGITFLM